MKIIFVRHGHPNYQLDCLTELGHPQAESAAERLKDEKIDLFFSSSCGRAYETACHIAQRHKRDVTQLDFIRELRWGIKDTDDYAHPWALADEWVAKGKDVNDADWQNDPEYKGVTLASDYNKVADGFDKWLAEFGYEREGNYYRVARKNDDTVLLASHAGASTAALSHFFNIPFLAACKMFSCDYTAITVVTLGGDEGELTSPRFKLVNDARHIEGLTTENVYGR